MPIRRILTVAEPADMAVLKSVSTPAGEVDDALRALMDDMLETMYAAPGIGLAAVQVGVPKRVVVMDLAREGEPPQPRRFLDPEITWRSAELASYDEGCLSIPEIYEGVERPAKVRFDYTNEAGERVRGEEADGLYAVCIQHEIDHCDGVLFLDHLSRLKRDRAVAKVRKAARQAA